MEPWFRIALSNALCAGLLAIPALLASRLARRPALAHGLWLLVLLKLLTPPLLAIPIDLPGQPAEREAPATLQESEPLARLEPHGMVVVPFVDEGADRAKKEEGQDDKPINLALFVPVPPDDIPESTLAAPAPAARATIPAFWPQVVIGVWLMGSLAWLALVLWRVLRFQRLLRYATPAPESLRREVARLARRLDLPGCPSIWLVPGRLTPMLWGVGTRPRLLLPAELWAILDCEQRATLLVHELAHLVRRDHWVRWLETAAMLLYWWHPVVWLARKELREAEEQCCDAWVVWALPGAGKTYALALLECVDFLSDQPTALPTGACGIGQVNDLKRRLTMIMGGTTPRQLTRAGVLAVLGLALLLLPVLPTTADEPPPERREQPNRPAQRQPNPDELDRARAELRRAQAELQERMAQVRQAEQRMRELAERVARLEGASGKREIRVIVVPKENQPGGLGGRPQLREVPRGGNPAERRLEEMERKLDAVMRELEAMRRQMQQPNRGPNPDRRNERQPDPNRRDERRPNDRRPGEGGATSGNLELEFTLPLQRR